MTFVVGSDKVAIDYVVQFWSEGQPWEHLAYFDLQQKVQCKTIRAEKYPILVSQYESLSITATTLVSSVRETNTCPFKQ